MANIYLETDPRTAGEWHTSKFDKFQYFGSCEEVFAFDKDKRTLKYLENLSIKDGSTGCCLDICIILSLTG